MGRLLLSNAELRRSAAPHGRRPVRPHTGAAPGRRVLARDLPAVWAAPTTTAADRKAMLRLVMEAIAIHPVDIPTRATRIRVQWTSGVVSELIIARPDKGEYRAHAPDAIERIRQLAAAGLHDDEIATQQLNSEARATGSSLAWKEDLVRWARRHKGIELVVADLYWLPFGSAAGSASSWRRTSLVRSAGSGNVATVVGKVCGRLRALVVRAGARLNASWRRLTRPLPLVTGLAADLLRSRRELVAENVLLRQQLIVATRKVKRPTFRPHERGLLVLLARLLPRWRDALLLVKPETVLRWHRAGFRLFWRHTSKADARREPKLAPDLVALIRQMAASNCTWGSEPECKGPARWSFARR
jgi:hypothetical protein